MALAGATDLVEVQRIDPHIRLDIRYATTNNFTGHKVYDSARCFLRPATVAKLSRAQRELERSGYGLKVYDGYRPLSVQKKFWALVPDERYVADPAKGSRHNRGAAVDLTMVRLRDGAEVPMPTRYDDFTEKAHRDYKNLPAEVLRNRQILEDVMVRNGFVPFPTEWWHFDDADWERYPVLDIGFSEIR